MAEQKYKAVMAVISDGRTITQVARDWGVSRQTMHAWLARYEADGLEGLANLSHRPTHCPHQMAAAVEVVELVGVEPEGSNGCEMKGNDADRGQQNQSDHRGSDVAWNSHPHETVDQQKDDQRADHRSPDSPLAARQRHTPKHNRSQRLKFPANAGRRIGA